MPSESASIALIGAGTIGLSFAALHLSSNPATTVRIFDTRPDLQQYIDKNLPGYLIGQDVLSCNKRISHASSIEEAVKGVDVVQEQGPEQLSFKSKIWQEIEMHAPKHALFWSSTSGIAASRQCQDMQDKSRVVVVHPFNPPHIMPLLEIVPSPETSQHVIDRTLKYWRDIGRDPVVIRKECPGFVANRLAFALLREACSLVKQGVVSVEELDRIVETSMGPRWTLAGPFKSYHAGGGGGGLRSFLDKLGSTVQDVWAASESDVKNENIVIGSDWQGIVATQADGSYGEIDTAERDERTRKLLAAIR